MSNAIAHAMHGLRANTAYYLLSALMVACGVGVFATMSSVLTFLSADPAASLGRLLLHPNYISSVGDSLSLNKSGMPWVDAQELARATEGVVLSTEFVSGNVILVHESMGMRPRELQARFTTRTFFSVFRIPVVSGSEWSRKDDEEAKRVVVISSRLSKQLFGSANPVGKTLRLSNTQFEIIGVAEDWSPKPHFYDLGQGGYANSDDLYIPFRTARALKENINGSISCSSSEGFPELEALESSDCSWVQLWFLANSNDAASRAKNIFESYNKMARMRERKSAIETYTANEWINAANLLPSVVRAQTFIALGFLLICITNVTAIILVISLKGKRTIGIHRALGATRFNIITNVLIESSSIAVLGAIGGVILTFVMFALLRQRPEEYYQDMTMSVGTVVLAASLSVVATLVAAVLPAVYMSRLSPVRLLGVN